MRAEAGLAFAQQFTKSIASEHCTTSGGL